MTTQVRRPRQARAKFTVDAILDAAEKLLVKEGFEHATTNRIAAVAGVSVGTLYQYFPDKETIVASLAERHMDAMRAILQDALVRVAALPPEDAARELVATMFRAHAVNPALHRVLLEQVPVKELLARSHSLEQLAVTWVRGYLEVRRDDLRDTDLDLAAFVVAQAVEGLTHAVTLHHPEKLGDPRLVDEIARLVTSYLAKPAAAPARPSISGRSRTGVRS